MTDQFERDTLEWLEGDMPFSTRFGDHFYARNDGRAECGHVFMGGNGLPERWEAGGEFTIGELGFGTGLNFLETWRQWRQLRQPNGQLHFVSFEAFPMDVDIIERAIARWPDLVDLCVDMTGRMRNLTLEPTTWVMDQQTTLTIVVGAAEEQVSKWKCSADAWYLDGFAPARNPDMWSEDLMQAVYDHSTEGGTFASYTAAGWVRRNLQAAGFEVEKARGFGGKRDMIKGRKMPHSPKVGGDI